MWAIFRKEFLELRQNPRIFGIVIVAPILQLTILGYAANTDVKNVPVIFADGSRTALSRTLIARFEGSPYFDVLDTVTTVAEVDPYIERGEAWLAIAIPVDYEKRISEGGTARLQLIADGSDANSVSMALSYASNLVSAHAVELLEQRVPPRPPRRTGRADPRLVQPAAPEPRLLHPRRPRPAPARRDLEPVVDGDRPGA